MFLELYSGQKEVSPVLSDRNHLGHTVPATTGRDLEPMAEIHTAFDFAFSAEALGAKHRPAQLPYKLGRPRKSWSLAGCGSTAQTVSLWCYRCPTGPVSFSEGAGKVALASKQAKLPPPPKTISLQGMAFVSMLGKPWKLLAASLHPRMDGEKRKSL